MEEYDIASLSMHTLPPIFSTQSPDQDYAAPICATTSPHSTLPEPDQQSDVDLLLVLEKTSHMLSGSPWLLHSTHGKRF
ncbi:hypothetical protein Pelo_11637 [Pelomyxa schiedti]|nr:hypothetical protein Pelo_11637 [Pelomyxa schiedti]